VVDVTSGAGRRAMSWIGGQGGGFTPYPLLVEMQEGADAPEGDARQDSGDDGCDDAVHYSSHTHAGVLKTSHAA
jgi:hypothetical protein